ncbi:MAG: hypothetical protein HQ464_10700 [Planctomycetes bacterium]|nr:hypothetical protein [Planctomycetota bacterium]
MTGGNGFLPATGRGILAGNGAGDATKTGDESAQQSASEFGIRDAASLGMGLLPVVGSVLSLVELVTAYDYVADRPADRFVAAAGIGAGLIPGGKIGLKGLTRIGGAAVRSADDVADVARGAARAAGSVDNAAVAGKNAIRQAPKTARPFNQLDVDARANPNNWEVLSAHSERASRKGSRQHGSSTQTIYRNKDTGETIVRHTVTDDAGKVVDDHFRPHYKPRAGDLDD